MFSFNFYDEPIEEKEVEHHVEEAEIKSIPLEDIISQLPDTLAYSLLGDLPRRELWHIKMQIMQNDRDEYLLGDSDVIKGSYEGGLKTWECSVDLAEYLSQQTFPNEMSVLEVILCPMCPILRQAWLWVCVTDGVIILSCFTRSQTVEIRVARLQ
jgi:hypothetical protein